MDQTLSELRFDPTMFHCNMPDYKKKKRSLWVGLSLIFHVVMTGFAFRHVSFGYERITIVFWGFQGEYKKQLTLCSGTLWGFITKWSNKCSVQKNDFIYRLWKQLFTTHVYVFFVGWWPQVAVVTVTAAKEEVRGRRRPVKTFSLRIVTDIRSLVN